MQDTKTSWCINEKLLGIFWQYQKTSKHYLKKIGDEKMEKKIMELQNIETFWHDVKVIIGYYENKEWEDYQIKQFQRVADYRYEQLKEMNEC